VTLELASSPERVSDGAVEEPDLLALGVVIRVDLEAILRGFGLPSGECSDCPIAVH